MKLSTARSLRVGLALTCALLGFGASADVFDDAFSHFDRSMATFNPIGTYIRKPIERLSPVSRSKVMCASQPTSCSIRRTRPVFAIRISASCSYRICSS